MATKQNLTLASMWAFEDIGIQEIEKEFKETVAQFDSLEYLQEDDALVVKGVLENLATRVASTFASFIEEQKNKDLLDMPRIRQLEVPDAEEEGVPDEASAERAYEANLLDDNSDEEFIPLSRDSVTKFWISSKGGLGCFSNNFQEVLMDVSAATGTDMAVVGDAQGIRVTGTTSDVDDALAKLSNLEKSLSLLLTPALTNIMVAPHKDEDRFQIQSYRTLNPLAPSRVLADPRTNGTTDFGEMSATVFLRFDNESQTFTAADNLRDPPRCSEEVGQSRIWGDFAFQEIGKGDGFPDIDSIIENNPEGPHPVASGIAPPHPFLTAEKAKQVNQWVVERAEMGSSEPEVEVDAVAAEYEAEIEVRPKPKPCITQSCTPSVAETIPTKRPPGIKTRRAAGTTTPSPPAPAAAAGIKHASLFDLLQGNEPKPTAVNPTKAAAAPRKKWKMKYSPDMDDQAIPTDKAEPKLGSQSLADMLELSGSSLGSTTPQTPKGKVQLPANFDAGKYGLNKAFRQTASNAKTPGLQRVLSATPKKKPSYLDELVDVFAPASNAAFSTPAPISFSQPALIPLEPVPTSISNGNAFLHETSGSNFGSNRGDFTTTYFDGHVSPNGSSGNESIFSPASNNAGILQGQEDKLSSLKGLLEKQQKETLIPCDDFQSQISRNAQNYHEKSIFDEIATREFYRTMGLKTAKPSSKAQGKAEIKAKRQATLEDAWGTKKAAKKPSADVLHVSPSIKDTRKGSTTKVAKVGRGGQRQKVTESSMSEDIKRLYDALKPTLEAAEYFPGALSLEVQIGLILIPLLPKTCTEGSLISFNDWVKVFQPQSGVPAPTTKFVSRLTTSGLDIDHIVDLKTSASGREERIFEQDYSEYSVFYEFHCRTKTAQPFIVTVDEQGKFTIKKPTAAFGAVNLHFPRQIWDARVVLNGITTSTASVDAEFEEAVQYLVDHLWVQPNKSLIRIFTRLPPGNKIVVEKVFMKRWTRHRFIHSSTGTAHSGVVNHIKNHSSATAASGSKDDVPNEGQGGVTSESDAENQGLFLQVMEVQDLCIGSIQSGGDAVMAHCAPLAEMTKNGRQWYEVSLVSSAIETILKANANVEVGERTDEWRSSDLLGRDATIFADDKGEASVLSPVAKAIGVAGLGDLLRLTKTVVEKIDGVGYWNYGPNADAFRMAELTKSLTALDTLNGQGQPAALRNGETATVEQKSLDFDDLKSIQEASSVIALMKNPSVEPSAKDEEQLEFDYW